MPLKSLITGQGSENGNSLLKWIERFVRISGLVLFCEIRGRPWLYQIWTVHDWKVIWQGALGRAPSETKNSVSLGWFVYFGGSSCSMDSPCLCWVRAKVTGTLNFVNSWLGGFLHIEQEAIESSIFLSQWVGTYECMHWTKAPSSVYHWQSSSCWWPRPALLASVLSLPRWRSTPRIRIGSAWHLPR